jgi:hypothetical protein
VHSRARAQSCWLVASRDLTFRWQSAYAAFSIARNNTTPLFDSIERQRAHHRTGASLDAWEQIERDDESSA